MGLKRGGGRNGHDERRYSSGPRYPLSSFTTFVPQASLRKVKQLYSRTTKHVPDKHPPTPSPSPFPLRSISIPCAPHLSPNVSDLFQMGSSVRNMADGQRSTLLGLMSQMLCLCHPTPCSRHI